MTDFIDRAALRNHRRKRLSDPIAVARVTESAQPKPIAGTRRIAFRYSDETVDSFGDRILARGWQLSEYEKNPVALFAHDGSRPENVIGRSWNLKVQGSELVGEIEFAPAETNPNADLVFKLYSGGFLRAVSVGFEPLDFELVNEKGRDGIDFKRQRLLEISAVPIPANPNALALARSRGIDTTPLRRWAERALDENRTLGMTKQTLEQVARDGRSEKARGRWKGKSRAEMLAMLSADDTSEGAETMTPFGYGERQGCTVRSPGLGAARFIAGMLTAEKKGASAGAEWVQRRFRDDEAAGHVKRALNTTGTTAGGALIPQAFAEEIIELLRAQVVVRRAGPRIVDISGGNLTMPRMVGGAVAGYQGELDDIASSQETFDDLQLNAKKLTALVAVSNDLLRRAPFDVDAVIRDDLVQTVARREDIAFLSGDGTEGSPVGLINQVPSANRYNITPFTAFDSETVASQTVGAITSLQAILRQNMAPMRTPTWIGTPGTFAFLRTVRDEMGGFLLEREMKEGKLFGFPYFETQQLASNLAVTVAGATQNVGAYLYLVDMSEVIIGETYRIAIDTSADASYSDTNGSVVSSFSGDKTLYRAITEHDFALRHQASCIVATLPGWLPPGFNAVAGSSPYFAQALSGDGSAAASTWGTPVTGANVPGTNSAAAPGGTQPGRA